MTEYQVSTPQYTVLVGVQGDTIIQTAPYLKRHLGQSWTAFRDRIHWAGATITRITPMPLNGYTQADLFRVPWVVEGACWSLRLPKAHLEVRMSTIGTQVHVRYRKGSEAPITLGNYASFEEGKFHSYARLLHFAWVPTGATNTLHAIQGDMEHVRQEGRG
jgi:hypothetical protein